ncbi:DNA repair protein RecO [Sneathiella glossodoripedis]|uniref:DNA repair protein RecO n=1 Tax=Sneathiella glossodoripedis TaxID=418853 RepID=UPI00046E531D|nr:DNA repair protein RecO [Sneathiella glossodoripedis]
MHWSDEGIILSVRKHGESSVIIHALTHDHGRHAGLVRGGSGKRLRGILQPGNLVGLNWNGRLAEHLGNFTVEAISSGSLILFDNPLALSALSAALGLLEKVLPEREAHPKLFDATCVLVENLDQTVDHWGPLFVKWELGLLRELGYGLDLEKCVATGQQDDLVYVSPRSAGAVSRDAGLPYHDKLLKLPAFLQPSPQPDGVNDVMGEVLDGLELSGYFLHKNLLAHYSTESLPARERLLNSLHKRRQKNPQNLS